MGTDASKRGLLDHLGAWVAAGLLGLYGVGSFVGLLAPQPPDAIRDGFTGVIVFPAIASLDGAVATLQHEHRFLLQWQPSLRGALTLSWVGGWTHLLALAVIGDLASRGAASARETFVFGLLFGSLFVALPWFLARLRKRPASQSERAFLDP